MPPQHVLDARCACMKPTLGRSPADTSLACSPMTMPAAAVELARVPQVRERRRRASRRRRSRSSRYTIRSRVSSSMPRPERLLDQPERSRRRGVRVRVPAGDGPDIRVVGVRRHRPLGSSREQRSVQRALREVGHVGRARRRTRRWSRSVMVHGRPTPATARCRVRDIASSRTAILGLAPIAASVEERHAGGACHSRPGGRTIGAGCPGRGTRH